MTPEPNRRQLLETSGLALLASALPLSGAQAATQAPAAHGAVHDFDFLHGAWRVRHRRLKERLAGNNEWEEFDGTCVCQPMMAGAGNVDDNLLELPAGTYRAIGLRSFDPAQGHWSIWWLDGRFPNRIDVPVVGGFENGVGTFIADDTLRGRPIKARFMWSDITATTAQWRQAFSPDGGATWETNWVMHFTRTA
jgi:hypothetical protein